MIKTDKTKTDRSPQRQLFIEELGSVLGGTGRPRPPRPRPRPRHPTTRSDLETGGSPE